MSNESMQARRLGRIMAVASLGGTIMALAAWCVLGATAGASVYGGLFFTLAAVLIVRVGLRSFAPALEAHQAPHGVMGGRKASR